MRSVSRDSIRLSAGHRSPSTQVTASSLPAALEVYDGPTRTTAPSLLARLSSPFHHLRRSLMTTLAVAGSMTGLAGNITAARAEPPPPTAMVEEKRSDRKASTGTTTATTTSGHTHTGKPSHTGGARQGTKGAAEEDSTDPADGEKDDESSPFDGVSFTSPDKLSHFLIGPVGLGFLRSHSAFPFDINVVGTASGNSNLVSGLTGFKQKFTSGGALSGSLSIDDKLGDAATNKLTEKGTLGFQQATGVGEFKLALTAKNAHDSATGKDKADVSGTLQWGVKQPYRNGFFGLGLKAMRDYNLSKGTYTDSSHATQELTYGVSRPGYSLKADLLGDENLLNGHVSFSANLKEALKSGRFSLAAGQKFSTDHGTKVSLEASYKVPLDHHTTLEVKSSFDQPIGLQIGGKF